MSDNDRHVSREIRDKRGVVQQGTGLIKDITGAVKSTGILGGTIFGFPDIVRKTDETYRSGAERAETYGNRGEIARRRSDRTLELEQAHDEGRVPNPTAYGRPFGVQGQGPSQGWGAGANGPNGRLLRVQPGQVVTGHSQDEAVVRNLAESIELMNASQDRPQGLAQLADSTAKELNGKSYRFNEPVTVLLRDENGQPKTLVTIPRGGYSGKELADVMFTQVEASDKVKEALNKAQQVATAPAPKKEEKKAEAPEAAAPEPKKDEKKAEAPATGAETKPAIAVGQGSAADVAAAPAATATAHAPSQKEMNQRAQAMMEKLGLDTGQKAGVDKTDVAKLDGIIGAKSGPALKKVQEALGLPADGKVTPDLLTKLEKPETMALLSDKLNPKTTQVAAKQEAPKAEQASAPKTYTPAALPDPQPPSLGTATLSAPAAAAAAHVAAAHGTANQVVLDAALANATVIKSVDSAVQASSPKESVMQAVTKGLSFSSVTPTAPTAEEKAHIIDPTQMQVAIEAARQNSAQQAAAYEFQPAPNFGQANGGKGPLGRA